MKKYFFFGIGLLGIIVLNASNSDSPSLDCGCYLTVDEQCGSGGSSAYYAHVIMTFFTNSNCTTKCGEEYNHYWRLPVSYEYISLPYYCDGICPYVTIDVHLDDINYSAVGCSGSLECQPFDDGYPYTVIVQ